MSFGKTTQYANYTAHDFDVLVLIHMFIDKTCSYLHILKNQALLNNSDSYSL